MDINRPEDVERQASSLPREAELAEAKLRSFERARPQTETHDTSFTDKAGHDVSLRTWESGNHAYVRAYDTAKVQVPDTIDTGQAGYANAMLEHPVDGQTRVRLNDIGTSPDYRRSGIGSEMLSQVEQYGRDNNATEVYGSIDSQGAQDFWKSQAEKGWGIDYSKGAYGQVYKKLE